MLTKTQLETLDTDGLVRYAEIATHKEKHLILQIMAERSVKARHDIDEGVRRLYETLKSYTESVNDDGDTLDSIKG